MSGIIFSFAGGHAGTVNNILGSSISVGQNNHGMAVVQGVGIGANIMETYSQLVSDLDTSNIGNYADDFAKKAGAIGAGVGIIRGY